MFTENQRQIFKFHDGTGEVALDPMLVRRRLSEALDGQDIGVVFGQLRSEAREVWMPAMEKLAAVAYAALGVQPLDRDGNGMTEEEVARALSSFFEFEDLCQKKVEGSPSSSPATAGQPVGSVTAAPSVTSSSTASN